jgi:enoyl-CoA hydratase/carnithine racemase
MTLVLRSDAAGVATLTLNRPEKLNALNPATFHELRAHLDAVAEDTSVRCIVLTGAGRSFCAGNDLDAIASGEGRAEPMLGPETVDALEQVTQPTIAKIRGHCFTGGLELALACDFLVSAETTKFGDTHGQWGLVPVWGMSIRLPERVGLSNAKDLMFTARRIDGTAAKAIGLVDRCVPDEELDPAVDTLAAEIATNSPGTNRIVKRLLRERMERNRPDALAYERSSPHGFPEDMAERMARPRKG